MSRSTRLVVAAIVLVAVAVIGYTRLGSTNPTATESEQFVYYPLVTNGFEYRRVGVSVGSFPKRLCHCSYQFFASLGIINLIKPPAPLVRT